MESVPVRNSSPIHFRTAEREPNYPGAIDSILKPIQEHLQPEEYTEGGQRRSDALTMTLFVRRAADVMMSHGLADKNYLFVKRKREYWLNTFRHVLVPGNWMRQRILKHSHLNLSEDQVHVVGWPRIDLLLGVTDRQLRLFDRPRVLWAPTHDFTRYGDDEVTLSTYPEFSDYLPELARHCDVDVSLHPRNREDKRPTIELLLEADIVIADFGTLVYEAWALGKPVIFPHWIIGERLLKYLPDSAEWHIFANRIGWHADSFRELIDFIHAPRVLGDDVHNFLRSYLEPSCFGRSGRHIASLLRKFASEHSSKSYPAPHVLEETV